MLEKIGLPAKPSLRGNNWVVDSSHCQGCSSQFTFINRKHHCRRCGGLFCNSCTQQRMLLRGQGDSPVRICDSCKKLEEAARFEMRHGHKARAGRGGSKLTSKNEEEIMNQILGNDGKDSGQELLSNSNVGSSMQRGTSSALCSNSREDTSHYGVGEIVRSVSVDEPNHVQSGGGSASPEELRQQALDEKKKYKVLKGEGKSAEALRAFKRGKELERQADALEISLRKERKKVLLSASSNVADDQIKDGPSESGRRNKVPPPTGKEKDDLSAELKELGWSDMDLRDEEKKQASLSVEGELYSLLGEVSQKTDRSKVTGAIDKTQVVALKKKALMLKREGKLAEAKEELKRAKVLEKELEEQEFLAEADESDDELSALIHSMDDEKQEEFSIQHEFNFDHLIGAADDNIVDSHFDVTDEDMEDPEIAAALTSLGWSQESNIHETSATLVAAVDREALLCEIQSLKREALNHKRAGNVTEAMTQLKKAKLLERDLESLDSHQGNGENDPTTVHKQTADKSSKSFMEGDGNINTTEDMGSKPARKSKLMIQRELLGLKKKALALRRDGRVDEAEEELKKGRALEQQLEEIENSSVQKAMPRTAGSKVPYMAHEHPNISASLPVDEEEHNVTDQDLNDPAYLSMLKNLGWNEDDNEVANLSSEFSKKIDNVPANVPVGGSRRSKTEIQRELLGLKRKALALRRQGETEGAEELLKKAKELEDQMGEMEAPKKEPPLNSAMEEGDGGDVRMQDPALLSVGTSSEVAGAPAPRSEGQIQRELLDLKRKALAFRQKGEIKEAEEALRMAKVLEVQIEEFEAPKDVCLNDNSKEEKQESFELLVNTENLGNSKDDMEVRMSTQAAMGPIDEVMLSVGSGSVRSHAAHPPLRNTDLFNPPTSHFAEEKQPLPVELGAFGETLSLENQRIAEGFSQISPPVQSGNFIDLLTGDDWGSSQRPTEKQDDSLKFDSVGSFTASPPIQLGSLTRVNDSPAKQDNSRIDKQEDMVLVNEKRDANEGNSNSVLESASQSNQSDIRQEILAFKRRALAFKREGKLAEARDELRQAKLLERHLEEDCPQSKTTSSDVSSSANNIHSSGQKNHGSPSLDRKPLSSRDRFKLQQESLGHKRQAMKLRREGRMEEAEAEFELAKALENKLEESAAHDIDRAEPLDDVSVEGLLDPQLLSALKAIGIEDASMLSQGPERPEPSRGNVGKSNNVTQDRSQLEEQIKAEKVRALNLKRAGKQAEALDALRKAKLLEKQLNSSPS